MILTREQLPTIIKNLGFAKDANEVQLWSVIPYAVAAVITGLCCNSIPLTLSSDLYTSDRGYCL